MEEKFTPPSSVGMLQDLVPLSVYHQLAQRADARYGRRLPPPAGQSEPESIPAPLRKTTPATAESGLTLAELERIALECNPTLAQAAMNVRAAEGTYVQAGLYPNPTVGYVGDEIGNDGTAGFQGGFISQEIVTAGKLRLGRAVASHGIQRARYLWKCSGCACSMTCGPVLHGLVAQRDRGQPEVGCNQREDLKTTERLQKAQSRPAGRASVPD